VTINIELALLGKAFTLAVRARRLRVRPYIPKLAADLSRVRRGFFSRDEVEQLAERLPDVIGDVVLFLFFSTWRVGEARTLLWRDYDRTDSVIRLRPKHSKNRHGRLLPVEGELATIIERRWQARLLDCPYIFHRDGKRIGDFRKVWDRACRALGFRLDLGLVVRHEDRAVTDAVSDEHLVGDAAPVEPVEHVLRERTPASPECGRYVLVGEFAVLLVTLCSGASPLPRDRAAHESPDGQPHER
jgi:integrase